jgi:REP element-mobilizing transposase RayT
MAHSSTTIWILSNWTTWEKTPLITHKIKNRIHKYIFQEFTSSGCLVRIINGLPDEVQCLFLLNPKKSLDDIIKMVKGATSHRINQENLTSEKFAWQKSYNASSVSEKLLEKVSREIDKLK